jgi:hypothetical protein
MAPCAGITAEGACWVLGDLGEPCDEVCGTGAPLDAAFTLTRGSSSAVVDAVSRHYGLHAYVTTTSLDETCRHEEHPEQLAAFVYFPESHAWDCLPGETTARLARLYRASCACSPVPSQYAYLPPGAPVSPLALFVAMLAIFLAIGLCCALIYSTPWLRAPWRNASSLSSSWRSGAAPKLLRATGWDPGYERLGGGSDAFAAHSGVMMSSGPAAGGVNGIRGARGTELVPWTDWLRSMLRCCFCCCFESLQRCWRAWGQERLRDEIVARQEALAEQATRDTWFTEMSRRYGGSAARSPSRPARSWDPGYDRLDEPGSAVEARYNDGPSGELRIGYRGGVASPAPTPGGVSASRPIRMRHDGTPVNEMRSPYPTGTPADGTGRSRQWLDSGWDREGRSSSFYSSPGMHSSYSSRIDETLFADSASRPPSSYRTGSGGADGIGAPSGAFAPRHMTTAQLRTSLREAGIGFREEASRAALEEALEAHRASLAGGPRADVPLRYGGPGGGTGRVGGTPNNRHAEQSGVLTVHVRKGVGLKPADLNGKSDPYVIVKVGGGREKKTRVAKRTLDPEWNESVEFTGSLNEMIASGLSLRVLDWDNSLKKVFGSDDPLGDLHVPLDFLRFDDFRDFSEPMAQGSLLFSVSWQPLASTSLSGGTLHVVLERATDLKSMDRNGFSDPFVKLSLCGTTHKSKVQYKTLNPTWSERFMWHGTLYELTREPLQLQCIDYDRFSRNDPLGNASVKLDGLQVGEWRDYAVRLSEQGVVHLQVRYVGEGGGGDGGGAAIEECGPSYASDAPASTAGLFTPHEGGSYTRRQRATSMPPLQQSASFDDTALPSETYTYARPSRPGNAWEPTLSTAPGSLGSVLPPLPSAHQSGARSPSGSRRSALW